MKILLDNFSCALVLILCFPAVILFIIYGRKIAKLRQLKGKIEKLEKIKNIIAQSWQVRGERDYKKIVQNVEKIFIKEA